MKSNIRVTVVCTAYNQEKYITDAIEGFLMQETDFDYEIIIHDDASIDQTPSIIREYQKKYPQKIKIIMQTENKYSKGENIIEKYMLPLAQGDYIALCEGDDYWTNAFKLQKQVEALDNHPEVDVCAHSAIVVDAESKNKIGEIKPAVQNMIFSVKDVIEGDGGFVATNSLMLRKQVYNDDMPTFRKVYKIDYTLQILASLRGGMIYLSDYMSAYRSCSDMSWTTKMMNNTQEYCKHFEKVIHVLEQLNIDTNRKYEDVILRRIRFQRLYILETKKKYKEIFYNKDIISELSLKQKIKLWLKAKFPWLIKLSRYRYGKK